MGRWGQLQSHAVISPQYSISTFQLNSSWYPVVCLEVRGRGPSIVLSEWPFIAPHQAEICSTSHYKIQDNPARCTHFHPNRLPNLRGLTSTQLAWNIKRRIETNSFTSLESKDLHRFEHDIQLPAARDNWYYNLLLPRIWFFSSMANDQSVI